MPTCEQTDTQTGDTQRYLTKTQTKTNQRKVISHRAKRYKIVLFLFCVSTSAAYYSTVYINQATNTR